MCAEILQLRGCRTLRHSTGAKNTVLNVRLICLITAALCGSDRKWVVAVDDEDEDEAEEEIDADT